MQCRCGYNGVSYHPCHGAAYTCRKPAKERLVPIPDAGVTGDQLKVVCYKTWACDECWKEYNLLDNP